MSARLRVQRLAEVSIQDRAADEPSDPTLQGFREDFAELLDRLPEIKRVLVVVDDLDRCLSPTVIATLEAIKLVLSGRSAP